jgi:drug/metabolite transporter (DMT)-like permease
VFRHLHESPPGRSIWRDAIPPAAVHAVGQILFGLTPYFNDATVINFVSRVSLLFTTLFGFALLPEERPLARRPLFWIALAAAAIGLGAMFIGGMGTKSTCGAGMLILLGTSACWGLYSVLVRKCLSGYSIRLSFGVMSLYASPVLLILMFSVGNWTPVLHQPAWLWVLIWLSAIAGIALGHTLFYRAIHTLGPISSEGSLMLIPFVTALLASLLLHERLAHLQWIGGFVLVLGCLCLLITKTTLQRRGELHVAATTD